VWEPNDLLVFESVERAEAFTEPPDVHAGVAYDAEGRLLTFETDGRRTRLREREDEPTHEQELRDAIAQATLAAGSTLDASAPLEELVAAALVRFRV
jgi:sugar lactone lactonase YvrE